MVIAGMNMQSIIGILAKYGRISATGNEKKDVMNNPTLMDIYTIMKIYPMGDVK
jgi:hypothetical protein